MSKGRGSYYKKGTWNALCDVCGWKYKSDQLKLRWDGFMTCNKCWEPRHPMDFFKAPKEELRVPWTRPVPQDVFIDVPVFVDYVNWVATFSSGYPNWNDSELI